MEAKFNNRSNNPLSRNSKAIASVTVEANGQLVSSEEV